VVFSLAVSEYSLRQDSVIANGVTELDSRRRPATGVPCVWLRLGCCRVAG